MLVTGIKSKPVYAPLQADIRGRYHLMLGLGVGADPLLRVIAEMQTAAPHAMKNTRILYVPEAGNVQTLARFKSAAAGDVREFDGTPALLGQFRAVLQQSLMGTRLYVAGPESFIGLTMKIALEFNLNKDEIRAEECGTQARRVYCIHCRATTEDVRTNIVSCVACRRWLLVRDHYSRRLAAYMGVMADAEAPGELPPLKEVFL
jgi:hypothetical protein